MRHSVTVAIPVYNGEIFIKDAIISIINQNVKVNEIIIFDNKSTDSTIKEIENIKNEFQNINIRLFINDMNLGYQRNWNKCLENASSDFVLLLHADDMLKSDTIEKQLNFLNKHDDFALVGGQEDYVNEKGEISFAKDFSIDKLFEKGEVCEFVKETNSYIPCSSVMFDMVKIRKVGFFDTDVLATDELYWPKVLSQFPIAVLGESLINRRIHPGQTEYNDFKKQKEKIIDWAKHFRKVVDYEKRENKIGEMKLLVKRKISNTYLGISRSVIIHHKSFKLHLFYIMNCIKFQPEIIFELRFWKSLIKSWLIYLNFIADK